MNCIRVYFLAVVACLAERRREREKRKELLWVTISHPITCNTIAIHTFFIHTKNTKTQTTWCREQRQSYTWLLTWNVDIYVSILYYTFLYFIFFLTFYLAHALIRRWSECLYIYATARWHIRENALLLKTKFYRISMLFPGHGINHWAAAYRTEIYYGQATSTGQTHSRHKHICSMLIHFNMDI